MRPFRLLLPLILVLFCTLPAAAQKTAVLIVPGLAARDLTSPQLAPLQLLCREGEAGWMVCRAASGSPANERRADGLDSEAALLLTLASGGRAPSLPPSLLSSSPPVILPQGGACLSPALLSLLKKRYSQLPYPLAVGALGEAVQAEGAETAVLADAAGTEEENEALLFASDNSGKVNIARLSLSLPTPDAPHGEAADTAAMLQALDTLPNRVKLAVLCFPDIERADLSAPLCLPAIAAQQHGQALLRLGILLAGLQSRVRSGALRLILIAPGPAPGSDALDRLAPILMAGSGIRPGELQSPSTRWPGLAVNTDVLPTLVRLMALSPPAGLVGRAVSSGTEGPFTRQGWRAFQERLLALALQQDAFGGLPTVQLILLIALFTALRFARPRPAFACGAALAALPPALLLLPLLAPRSLLLCGFLLALLLIAAAFLGAWKPAETVMVLQAGLALAGLIGLLHGAFLFRTAWMSYSVMEGARYFGIGNEYMGALIGAALCLLPRLAPPGRRLWPAALLFAVLALEMAWPAWGAKVGAVPTAIFAFGAALRARQKGKLVWQDLLWLLLASGLMLGGIGLLDRLHSIGQQSHLGRALAGKAGGSLAAIAGRKLALEFHQIFRSPWTLTFIASAFTLKTLFKERPVPLPVRYGLTVGAAACLLFNDAGLIAASLLLTAGVSYSCSISGMSAER